MPVTFTDLGVSADISSRLAQQGIIEPVPIQEGTIPAALAGRDVCGRAPTGSGKTLAFGIPLVTRVSRARPGWPRALVLAPTRELAAQIERELTPLAATRQRKVAAVYGGVGFGNQLTALRRGADIVVAPPGRLVDLIERGKIHLGEVEVVVVDEADRMADMGFLPAVRRLLDRVRPDRQTYLFSATLDGEVDVLIRNYQHKPLRHEVAGPQAQEDLRQHLFWKTDRTRRVDVTSQIIARHGSTVVFCRTKRGAERLAKQLTQTGLTVAAIHGDRSQSQREKALAAFSGGRVQALIATDVAARGIHVDDVACVLHFDPPEDEKAYVHRSGRTGRAGAGGTVLSLVCEDNGAAVRDIQRRLGFPTRFSEPNVSSLHAAETPFRPAARPQPARPERAKADWTTAAGAPTPRRKPDGRPARSGSRRRSGTRRSQA